MSLEQTIDNLQIRNANMVTFVGTSNTMVDTTTGRIQTKGIQHNSNVITDVSGPHGRGVATLKKYPEIAFGKGKFDSNPTTNTFVQAGYTFVPSSSLNPTDWPGDEIFDGHLGPGSGWLSENSYAGTALGSAPTLPNATPAAPIGEYVTVKMPKKIKLSHMLIAPLAGSYTGNAPIAGKIYGGLDGTNWTEIGSFSGFTYSTNQYNKINGTSTAYYSHFALVGTAITDLTNPNWMGIGDWELYGYEEDPPAGDHSVDTTFKSRFNNPQMTGVQVLVDGATGVGTNQISGGPDPSGNQSTYVTDGKYWTLNGTLTSNLAVEANTFLEGDQPHAVSVWFNSSNLEANVSNTCVFSISDQEKLDSMNLDLQSNTWHNLTYAYQGGRGSRVTYLDGRKVSEDQAEDTFGEYPPFAMTGYSQGGYVVSASSEYGAAYLAHEAFNGTFADNGDCWLCANLLYDSGTGTYNGNANLGSDSGGPAFANADEGEWLKLKMPNKFVLDYITICGSTATGVNPKDWKIYGSNDDKNWDVLLSKTNTIIAAYNASSGKEHVVGASKAYKYFALVVTKSGGLSGDHYIHVAELEFYGHRENDLVRLPDPTNVLKYPHIAMTGPAQRGYVVSASSTAVYNASLAPKNAFNGIISPSSATASWQSLEDGYNSTPPYNYKASSPHTSSLSTSTTQYNGEWLSLETPYKIKIQSYKLYINSDVSNYRADSLVLLGSDTTTNGSWNLIHTETSATYTNDVYTATVNSNTSYKYHRLLFESLSGNGGEVYINELEFYGTGVDSIPIQIGGGNIDKVANFRVYDKFIDENQALEIWNAQKEEFGRAKPQMVLQQGKLGIGTDAPQGSLSVADEPHNLEEFPPRAMTANETYFEGHGVFKASSSSEYSPTYTAFDAFDKITNNDVGVADNAWLSVNSSLYASASDYAFTGSTTLGNGTVAGEWLKLELPYKIVLKSITLSPRPSSTNHLNSAPEDFKIYGSNNDINWTEVLSETGAAPSLWTGTNFITDASTTSYRYFAIVVQKTVGYANYTAISGLKFFGTREQGQSVLHDGQLTLTKSLNVPRIGPPLDADDTPRRDRLVVEYNTSTNPTFEGVVRDTSGRGNDGVFYGNTYYDATTKDLTFDGLGNDTIRGTQNIGTGEKVLTMAMWFKRTVAVNTWDYVCTIGTSTTGQMAGFTINSNKFNFTKYGAQTLSTTTINNDQWYHVVGVYKGGNWDTTNTEIYVNGVKETITGGTSSALNLTGNQITFGDSTLYDGTSSFNGQISNFKLYDVALTADEVKTLYDMGRNGSVANPQPLHIAAHLYSPGTIVQVEQAVKTDTQTTTVASPVDVSGLSVTIRPKFSNSKILVSYQVNMGGDYHMFLRVLRTQNGVTTIVGSGDAAGTRPLASSYQSHMNVNDQRSMNMEILEPCNGTDAIEYKVQFWVAHVNYTASINRAMTAADNVYNAFVSSSITAKEVCQ